MQSESRQPSPFGTFIHNGYMVIRDIMDALQVKGRPHFVTDLGDGTYVLEYEDADRRLRRVRFNADLEVLGEEATA
ncbi:MAG: hypothetical protein IRY95_04070 [Clostridia bacterium]|nr:hypothetical protein [Clostridia bacterium]